jgi:hypothetical protein
LAPTTLPHINILFAFNFISIINTLKDKLCGKDMSKKMYLFLRNWVSKVASEKHCYAKCSCSNAKLHYFNGEQGKVKHSMLADWVKNRPLELLLVVSS